MDIYVPQLLSASQHIRDKCALKGNTNGRLRIYVLEPRLARYLCHSRAHSGVLLKWRMSHVQMEARVKDTTSRIYHKAQMTHVELSRQNHLSVQ